MWGFKFACKYTTMKKALLILLLAVGNLVFAQNPIIFMPDAGLNDGSDEGGLNGGKETYVFDGDPNTNNGAVNAFYSLPISTCNNTNYLGMIQFDLTTLPAVVDSVFLGGWTWDQNVICYSNCDNNWEFWYVGAAWDEMAVTWGTAPLLDSGFAGPFNVTFPDVARERKFDITPAYRNWKSGNVPNYGLAIKPIDGFCNNACVILGMLSSDDTTFAGTHRPYLEIYSGGVGVAEAQQIKTRFFPNPAHNAAVIEFQSTFVGPVELHVLDYTGRTVSTQTETMDMGLQRITIDLEKLANGMYTYRLTTPSGNSSGMFVRQ